MSTILNEISQDMRQRLRAYLEEGGDTGGRAWPRRGNPRQHGILPKADRRLNLRVLIIGELAVELPFVVDGTRAELLSAVQAGNGRLTPTWRMGKPAIGGFAGHATRLASALGAQVHLRTVLSVPALPRMLEFLTDHNVKPDQLLALPGPCPVILQFQCTDGALEIHRPGVAAALTVPDAGHLAEYDVILADPNGSMQRQEIVGELTNCRSETSTIAICADEHWTDGELRRPTSNNTWTFVDGGVAEALVAHALDHSRHDRTTASRPHAELLVRQLKRRYGFAKIVVADSLAGAVMLNGQPDAYRADSCPIRCDNTLSYLPTVIATAAVSSRLGADDETSLRRGIAAASGQLAGLELPRTLDELDG